ncbi:hypothetical protein TNIN_258161 [Trichonephila inaurata madagascariensis]|uniref:Uncharacterized protein n=1 Tax=Trichonephila inaurata madagascariensis TaxID=2747483 RepID=A0A8X7BPY1_9ARAC|nr:hypothetical protein TNIN_258161 [Trichonephila inaurata madagascariensis]
MVKNLEWFGSKGFGSKTRADMSWFERSTEAGCSITKGKHVGGGTRKINASAEGYTSLRLLHDLALKCTSQRDVYSEAQKNVTHPQNCT